MNVKKLEESIPEATKFIALKQAEMLAIEREKNAPGDQNKKRGTAVLDSEYNLAKQAQEKALVQLRKASEQLADKKKRLAGTREELFKGMGITESTQETKEAFDRSIKKARDKLNNVRHAQIVEAIDDLISGKLANKVKRSLTVKVSDLEAYYGDAGYKPGVTGLKKRKKILSRAAGDNFLSNPNAPTLPSPTAGAVAGSVATTWIQDLAGSSSKDGTSKNPFQTEIDILAESLSKEKVIEFILLGDLLRIIFARLFKNIGSKAKNMNKGGKSAADDNTIQTIRQNLRKSVIVLKKLEIENFEKASLLSKNLYLFPVSVSHLRHILAKELYGKNKNTFTIFDLMNEIARLISLTRKRKEQVLNRENAEAAFTVKEMTYALVKEMSVNGFPYSILANHPSKPISTDRYLYGIVLNVRKSRQVGS